MSRFQYKGKNGNIWGFWNIKACYFNNIYYRGLMPDKGLMLETSASESLYGGHPVDKCKLSTLCYSTIYSPYSTIYSTLVATLLSTLLCSLLYYVLYSFLLYSFLLHSSLLCSLLYSTLLPTLLYFRLPYVTLLYSTLLYSTLLYSTLCYSTLLYYVLFMSVMYCCHSGYKVRLRTMTLFTMKWYQNLITYQKLKVSAL